MGQRAGTVSETNVKMRSGKLLEQPVAKPRRINKAERELIRLAGQEIYEGRVARGDRDFRKAIRLNPGNEGKIRLAWAGAYERKGSLECDDEDYEEAAKSFSTAASLCREAHPKVAIEYYSTAAQSYAITHQDSLSANMYREAHGLAQVHCPNMARELLEQAEARERMAKAMPVAATKACVD